MSKQITIKCKEDGTSFEVNTNTIKRSNFLNDICREYPDEKVIEIPDVNGPTMTLIVEWLQKHEEVAPKLPPQPLRNYDLAEVVGSWESEYMDRVYNKSYNGLFQFLNAANFLDISPLIELASAKTACLTKDLTPKEFKELFKIEEDCTEEDIKKIEEEVLKEREIQKEKERQRIEEEEASKEEK